MLALIKTLIRLQGTPPRPGSPWPQPNTLSLDDTYASISGRDLTFLSDVTCPILSTAFGRYDATFLFRDLPVTPSINTPILSQVRVVIPQDQDLNLCNQYPKLSRDPNHESCEHPIDYWLSITIGYWLVIKWLTFCLRYHQHLSTLRRRGVCHHNSDHSLGCTPRNWNVFPAHLEHGTRQSFCC